MSNDKKSGGSKKVGRSKRKKLNRSNPLSLYVRDKISFEKYYSTIRR